MLFIFYARTGERMDSRTGRHGRRDEQTIALWRSHKVLMSIWRHGLDVKNLRHFDVSRPILDVYHVRKSSWPTGSIGDHVKGVEH